MFVELICTDALRERLRSRTGNRAAGDVLVTGNRRALIALIAHAENAQTDARVLRKRVVEISECGALRIPRPQMLRCARTAAGDRTNVIGFVDVPLRLAVVHGKRVAEFFSRSGSVIPDFVLAERAG